MTKIIALCLALSACSSGCGATERKIEAAGVATMDKICLAFQANPSLVSNQEAQKIFGYVCTGIKILAPLVPSVTTTDAGSGSAK